MSQLHSPGGVPRSPKGGTQETIPGGVLRLGSSVGVTKKSPGGFPWGCPGKFWRAPSLGSEAMSKCVVPGRGP